MKGRGERRGTGRGETVIHQVRELHVRREIRARFKVDAALFTLTGNAILLAHSADGIASASV